MRKVPEGLFIGLVFANGSTHQTDSAYNSNETAPERAIQQAYMACRYSVSGATQPFNGNVKESSTGEGDEEENGEIAGPSHTSESPRGSG
jgi:hypothetical protein